MEMINYIIANTGLNPYMIPHAFSWLFTGFKLLNLFASFSEHTFCLLSNIFLFELHDDFSINSLTLSLDNLLEKQIYSLAYKT
jgi:hypothetical protein